ncbi:MAG: hypothetical protein AAF479_00725, partial [Pseudomonadota bacterium]
MSEYKASKHAVPYLISIARQRHIGFDGPGGNPSSLAVYEMNNDGSFKMDSQWRKTKTEHAPKAKPQGLKDLAKGKLHSANGGGANATVIKAVDWLCARMFDGVGITTINLCGHSRGSITAIAVAWAIEKLIKPHLPNIKVNLFLFDPAAGRVNEFRPNYDYNGHVF